MNEDEAPAVDVAGIPEEYGAAECSIDENIAVLVVEAVAEAVAVDEAVVCDDARECDDLRRFFIFSSSSCSVSSITSSISRTRIRFLRCVIAIRSRSVKRLVCERGRFMTPPLGPSYAGRCADEPNAAAERGNELPDE
jgi:hypothetical protein